MSPLLLVISVAFSFGGHVVPVIFSSESWIWDCKLRLLKWLVVQDCSSDIIQNPLFVQYVLGRLWQSWHWVVHKWRTGLKATITTLMSREVDRLIASVCNIGWVSLDVSDGLVYRGRAQGFGKWPVDLFFNPRVVLLDRLLEDLVLWLHFPNVSLELLDLSWLSFVLRCELLCDHAVLKPDIFLPMLTIVSLELFKFLLQPLLVKLF